jgi:hypothetical protein
MDDVKYTVVRGMRGSGKIRALEQMLCDRDAVIRTARAEIDRLKNASRWIPVTERLPEEEGWYLVYTTPKRAHKSINKAMFCKGYEWGNPETYWRGAGGHWANVTHWMPLPDAPEGGD